ncbi:hypothetical protein CSC81_07235 [Tenacibaculum discolor]|uniref:Phenylalanyl-tRNA synthetase subunit alpha n=1 Tax=Tenacibaculum discolor TaxID=361581 RepID=A0A2G1BW07_9FLAO|nr:MULTISPECIES: hypothetical protein [Tenacibaculum]MDP2540245.1 hypothetical protein [Tenacibaculum discolor]NVK07449.1 hypothetical protein [Tenacibaculum sp.]PHN98188.1 hypothetical protein CSC81_07235 [Tenacibaculum discolor]PHN99892.1 hypothetical protein CSC82_31670 [Rhodobacteraceae bacterium 4F10]
MKKDIEIPKVTGVEIAVVLETNEIDNKEDWNVYILNKKDVDLEMVVIVSQGFSDTKTTSVFRRKIDKLPANSYQKFELMQPELFDLDNRFQVTFFENNRLHDKTFIFQAETIQEGFLRDIEFLGKRGIVCK